MSVTISAALKAHLAEERTTIAACCKITRTDGQVYGFTQHGDDIVFDGVTYEASTGVNAYEFSSRSGLNVDNLEIVGGLDAASITEVDLVAGLWDYAACEFFIVNYADLTQGRMIVSSGTLGEVSVGDTEFTVEFRGLAQALQNSFGRTYLPSCDADYGDARCGLDLDALADHRFDVTVTSVVSQRQFVASGLTNFSGSPTTAMASGWLDYGKLLWTGGANAGRVSVVKTHTSGGAITLQLPTPYAISIADAFTVYRGCDKSAAACLARSNKINFRGFDKIPGRDRIMSGLD